MRLYPSAPIMGRLTVQEDELMGHRVPAGSNVVVVPWTIHRHPDFWVDPLVFDPSRFTGTGARPEPAHRYAWMPFGGGPRACIGQHFSMVEAVLALALILREHRVTVGGRLRPAAGRLAHHALPDRAGARASSASLTRVPAIRDVTRSPPVPGIRVGK